MLNPEQQLVVDSNSKRICCLAGAGAGKSKSLLARIDRLINEGVPSSQILALTFTNVAAAEMRKRFENTHVGILPPEFKTFHGFSYGILCRDESIRLALGYDKIPDIASEEIERKIHERAKAQCKITLSAEKLRTQKNLTRNEIRQTDLYDKAVTRIMKQEGVITFDMLNSEVSKLFINDDPSIHKYKQQYKYVCADEVQDSDQYQSDFLLSFTDSNVMCVGDVLQNIYAFRGCTDKFIKQIVSDSNWEKIKLFENYRSTKQICDYANEFSATYADESYRITMHSDVEGEDVVEREIEGADNYDAVSVSDLKLLLKDISDLNGTTAILCRSNKEVTATCEFLKANGIDYASNKVNNSSKLIECALSDDFMIGYLASHLSSAKYGEYIRLSAQHGNDVKWFMESYGDNPKIVSDSKKIMKLRDISSLYISTTAKLDEIKKTLNVDIPSTNKDLMGNDLLRYVQDSVEDLTSNELYVGTIHSVKGLEYDNVCVLNVNSYMFRIGDTEMNNLFYVAITRAKKRLFVYRLC